MQLSLDAADRLVELVEARRAPVDAALAARHLFALAHAPASIARALLDDVVAADARLRWLGQSVALAESPSSGVPLDRAVFVVVDLETTGLSPARDRICEIGAQRVRALELVEVYESLVDPRCPVPPAVRSLTGIGPDLLRGAPPEQRAIRELLDFLGDAPIVAHNARFDMGFLDRAVERLTGRRLAVPVIDTAQLARRLLAGRTTRFSLAALSHLFGTSAEPCHRALPDAAATAEILVFLIGLAQETGARNVEDLAELAAPRARRLVAKRSLVADAPRGPGVYVFRGKGGQVLYVGRARDLRTRLRSYFSGGRQRPAVEAALGALEAVDWIPHGSELEAALEELHLIRELRPLANVRGARPDRRVYLRRSGDTWKVTEDPTQFGPLPSRRTAKLAARALDGCGHDDPAAAVPQVRRRLRRLAEAQRFEDAARVRDRLRALEHVVEALGAVRRRRALSACLLAPAAQVGFTRAFFVTSGHLADSRIVPAGAGASLEVDAGLARCGVASVGDAEADPDVSQLLDSFVREPPPELVVTALGRDAILAALGGLPYHGLLAS